MTLGMTRMTPKNEMERPWECGRVLTLTHLAVAQNPWFHLGVFGAFTIPC